MGFLGVLRVCSFFELPCVFIIAFTLSHSHAQMGDNWLEENDGQRSLFFYQQPEYPRDCKDVKYECSPSNSSGVFFIKPVGYSEPFEVYCHNDIELGGWTVIQRRADGSVDFNRDWQGYKNGFGFLYNEFWIGNEKLSYLTNQANYELRIDMELSNGTSLFASYSVFRISDEWSQHRLVTVGDFHSNIDFSCPPNMIFGNCSCQPSCDDPSGVNNCNNNCNWQTESCVCAIGFLMKDGECVLPIECGCFITETNSVLLTGGIFVNADCSKKCTCEDGELSCNSDYNCGSNSACGVQDGVQGCYCDSGYEGDGESCSAVYTDCYDAYQDGNTVDGVYTILPSGWPGEPFSVLCNMTADGGGWTVFQRRIDGISDFYRSWDDYKHGFGTVSRENDFWLGNEQLFYLTNQKAYKLRVDITTSAGSPLYSEYSSFTISGEGLMYRLHVSALTAGNAGDGLHEYDNGGSFNTHDQDNDKCSHRHCAAAIGGAGWYTNSWCSSGVSATDTCNYFGTSPSFNWCSYFNLNGIYSRTDGLNMYWGLHCNIKYADMKIRPSST